jgi:hypothetical protein
MSFLLVALLIQTKFESLQSQSQSINIKKVFGSIVIASSMLNLPNIPQANADSQQRYNNKLNAPTAVGTRVNSDAESLLRYGAFRSQHRI